MPINAKFIMKYFLTITAFCAASALVSCGFNKKIAADYHYFQKGLDSVDKVALKEPVIKPYDLIAIQVYSNTLNQEQAAMFNTLGGVGGSSSGGTVSVSGNSISSSSASAAAHGATHAVDENGQITLPLIGTLPVAGLSTLQLRMLLKQKVAEFVKDPDVTVRFVSYKINIMGEVKNPGFKSLPNQRVTILDLLSESGDLTEFGRRDSILVVRVDSGKVKHYELDLRNASFMKSPAFQLQQNDLVYVRANSNKLKTVSADPTLQRTITMITALSTIILLPLNLIAILRR